LALSETLRKVDVFENEAMPITVVSANILDFGTVVFQRAARRSLEILNTGHVVARFNFVPRPQQTGISAPWIHIQPHQGIVLPGIAC
jgi:phosphatidylinositol-bisphosphatase